MIERTSKPEIIEYALLRFQQKPQRQLKELQEQTLKAAGQVAIRQNRRRELKEQAQNLGSAIAQMGHSTTLLQQLAGIESEIGKIFTSTYSALA